MDKPDRVVIEALVNLATNGALDRIDQRGKRARELYQWGLHPHHAKSGSPLDADNAEFAAAHPLALAGDAAVTQESLYPMMNASETSTPQACSSRNEQQTAACIPWNTGSVRGAARKSGRYRD
jgi:hypothetical protein